jgi:hypothetical protein
MRTKANLAIGLSVAFLVLLSVLHVLEPEFNPPGLISEYQLGHFGWLMSLAFLCLGTASLALFAAARQEVHTRPGRFGTWGLLIIGVAYFCAGIFPPGPKWFVGSLLHGIGGLVVIFGSPIVFTLVSKGFVRNEASVTATRPLIWMATLTWLSLAVFLRVQRRFPWCAALRQHHCRLDKPSHDHDLCLVVRGRGLSRSEQKPISILRSTA